MVAEGYGECLPNVWYDTCMYQIPYGVHQLNGTNSCLLPGWLVSVALVYV